MTFLGARTAGRQVVNIFPTDNAPQLHRLQADWCIVGAHIDDPDAKFEAVRARFTHLELWSRSGGVELSLMLVPSPQSTITAKSVDETEVPFRVLDENARLRVSSVRSVSPPGPWGAHINTYEWLELHDLSGWTLDEALTRFVNPVQALLTVLAGEKCSVTHLEVQVDGLWHAVYGGQVRPNAPRPDDEELLLDSHAIPLETLVMWCEVANRVSPAPQIVASAVGGEFATVEAEARALTTTAEGLDRALYPESRRFSKDHVGKSITALKASEVPDEIRDALIQALDQYFYEDSYPMRMKRLADEVAEAVPRCVGTTKRWKREIANLRIGLAHALHEKSGSTDDEIRTMHAKVRSLRWAIILRLLREAGVPAETLHTAVNASRTFQRDERIWRRRLPKVFSEPDIAKPTLTT